MVKLYSCLEPLLGFVLVNCRPNHPTRTKTNSSKTNEFGKERGLNQLQTHMCTVLEADVNNCQLLQHPNSPSPHPPPYHAESCLFNSNPQEIPFQQICAFELNILQIKHLGLHIIINSFLNQGLWCRTYRNVQKEQKQHLL